MNDYKIVFTGTIIDGFELDSVKEDFANLFSLQNVNRLEKIFSGSSIILKDGLAKKKANEIGELLNAIGLVVEVQSSVEDEPGLATMFQQLPDAGSEYLEDSDLATLFSQLPDADLQDPEDASLATMFDKLPDTTGDHSLATLFEKLPDGGDHSDDVEILDVLTEMQDEELKPAHKLTNLKEARNSSSTQSIDSAALAAAALFQKEQSTSEEKALLSLKTSVLPWAGFIVLLLVIIAVITFY